MYRLAVILALSAAACQAGNDVPPPLRAPRYPFLGRWDGTASSGGETYPLWFELFERGRKLEGRFQGREGSAVSMDAIEAAEAGLRFRVEGDSYTGSFSSDAGQGTGQKEDGSSFTWTAVRAPELPATANPRWREPVELFNGRNLRGWVARDRSAPNPWKARGGVLVNTGQGSDLLSESRFMDFKLHLEVNLSAGGNSGIYLRGRYEIPVEPDGAEPSGIYRHLPPKLNASLPPGEWHEVEVTLLGRWVTVTLNGRTILDHQEIPGITGGALDSKEGEPGPLMLQGDQGPVAFRNIVIRPLLVEEKALPR